MGVQEQSESFWGRIGEDLDQYRGAEMLGSHIYLGAGLMGLVYGLDTWVREEESMSIITFLEFFKNPSNITFLVQLSSTLVYTPIATLVCIFICFSHVCFSN